MLPTGSTTNHGFSLIELMVAVGIVGVLSTLATSSYDIYVCNIKEKERLACLGKAARYIEVETMEKGPIVGLGNYEWGSICNLPNFVVTNDIHGLDVNQDGTVNSSDAMAILSKIASSQFSVLTSSNFPTNTYYDMNGDGRITALDALLLNNWVGSNGSKPTRCN